MKKEKDLIQRIEKLEIALILLINQLRGVSGIPQNLLDSVERIILKER